MARMTCNPGCAALVISAIVLTACGTPPVTPSGTNPSPTGTPAPAGTPAFTVSGWVFDSASRELAGARVEVLTGARAGTVLIADTNGRFAFDQPLDRNVQVRASKEGYVDEIRGVGAAGSGSITGSTQQIAF